MKERDSFNLKPNRIRHFQNLALLDGRFWHGRYFRRGIGQPPKEPQPQNAIFNMKGEIIFFQKP